MENLNLSPEQQTALALKAWKNAKGKSFISRYSREEEDYFPLSFSQKRMWFLEQLIPGNPAYIITMVYRLKGVLHANHLEKALYEVSKRHEIWRTVFDIRNDQPVQIILPEPVVQMNKIDLRRFAPSEQNLKIEELKKEENTIPFHLKDGPLWRAVLVSLGDEENVLILSSHHIIMDGFSFGILIKELGGFYSAFVEGGTYKSPSLSIQYVDYSIWQNKNELDSKHLGYWIDKMKGELPQLQLPLDHPRPPEKTFHANTYNQSIPKDIMNKIMKFSRRNNASSAMVIMAIYKILLYYYSGTADILVGTPVAGRNHPETQPLLGCFINTLALRTKFQPEMSFKDWVDEVRKTMLEGISHQEVPFEKLVELLNPERSLSHSALFQVMFNAQRVPLPSECFTGLTMEVIPIRRNYLAYDLELFFYEEDEAVSSIEWHYNDDLFKEETIKKMNECFFSILDNVMDEPEQPIFDQLNHLSVNEYHRIAKDWNSEKLEYPSFSGMHNLFERQAELNPDETAIVFENQQLTYRHLNECSNRLANYLLSRKVTPETKIALFMDRSIEIIIGMLGILKAGCAYVPMDPIYPTNRIRFIMEDLDISTVVTHSRYAEEFSSSGADLLCMDRMSDIFSDFSIENPENTVEPKQLMYVLFTSGSTGTPKGVGIQHSNCLNYTHGIIGRLELKERMSYAIVTTFAADLGMAMIWGALATGGELHIISYDRAADPVLFKEYFVKNRIDVMKLVPSHFEMLQGLTYSKEIIPKKYLIFAGEASHWSMIEKIKALKPECKIQNHYGPTETTVSMLTYPVDLNGEIPDSLTVPLGKALPNTQVYILNEHLQQVPPGSIGELYIGGLGVSRGYLNRQDLTDERFIPDPYGGQANRKLYKTGDLVRLLPDGNIEFLGRIDYQIKIRGYRVELGEIENQIRKYELVDECIVVASGEESTSKRLVAYITLNQSSSDFKQGELREFLQCNLLDYMIPSIYIQLNELPLNSNGKVDRSKLPAPETVEWNHSGGEFIAPQNELQEKISRIWSEVLEVNNIGIDDNFFDLGGESFKAIRVVRKIDPSLSVVSLFKKPTIRGLAELLGEDQEIGRNLLIELTSPVPEDKQAVTLVCVPYGGGSAITYKPLADELREGIKLLAVDLPGHDYSRQDESLESLKDVATKCVDELKQKKTGAIAFYGHCLGGALALEMARILEEEGINVLGIFEAATFPAPRLPGKLFELLAKLFPRERFTSNKPFKDMLKAVGGLTEDLDDKEKDFIIRSMRHDFKEAEDYYSKHQEKSPKKLKAPITSVIGKKDRMTEFYQERFREWEFYSETVDCHVIPGAGHYFQKNQAADLAKMIDGKINEWTNAVPISKPMVDKADGNYSPVAPSLRVFFLVALGQLISMLGMNITNFALGVWTYQKTGVVTDFVFIGFANSLPAILSLPLGGVIADRYDRRKVMTLTSLVSVFMIVAAMMLFLTDHLAIWHVYIITAIGAVVSSFHRPAYLAAVAQLVPKKYLGHANGIIQLMTSTAAMLAPVLGGILIMIVNLGSIFIINIAAYSVAIVTLLAVRFPNALFRRSEEPIKKEIIGGWKYIIKRKPFVSMVVFFVVYNLFSSSALALMTPMILSFASEATLGWVTGATGLGGLFGAVIISIWGGMNRRADGMVGFTIMTGISLFILGCRPNIITCIIGAFGIYMATAFIDTHWQSIIQVKVGWELQGRFFATNQMLAWSLNPLGIIAMGPLVDKVFEPNMQEGKALANIFGRFLGYGDGRGMGFVMVMAGIIIIIFGFIGLMYYPLRHMEDILPDAVPDTIILDDKDALQEQADLTLKAAYQQDTPMNKRQKRNWRVE